jgi:hypothetical protein
MVDQAGHSITAIAAQSTALSVRHSAVAGVDRALADALTSAHRATVEALRRLDAIAADIESAVAQQDALGLDTAAGARQFQRFLIAKQHEISDIVSAAAAENVAKSAALQQLSAQYASAPASSTN